MKVGLFINTQYPEEVDVPAQIPALVEQVRVARDAGFKSLWFPHHWLTEPMQMLQIMPAMAFLAAEAKGMVIGPNILILPLLNPMHVAEEAATLDVLTGGNYVLGAGLGYREPEFTAFGIPLAERAGRFTESVTLMRKLWAGGKITHEGKFFTVRDAGISREAGAGGRAADLCRRPGRLRGSARRPDRRRVADRQCVLDPGDHAADAHLSRGAEGIWPHAAGVPDRPRMLCGEQPGVGLCGVQGGAGVQVCGLCGVGDDQPAGG